ncbi:hypothetical protein K488DRAFT_67391 [Vararia minispora EC-137]|uniref:Uncharacterized protein n=1 Tax=Vararia minispora EC-137 TaxID=1314806 RepID=A0ACB8QYN7_9AGAM|nr:hypothetical protein K488DRAFT_67391 [Vararia minispora EC-137]
MDLSDRYSLRLPLALLPLSPSLAAIHATRARRLSPEDDSLALSFCRVCGAFLLDGSASIRTKRAGKKRAERLLQAQCGTCGHANELEIHTTNPSPSPPPLPRAKKIATTPTAAGASASSATLSPVSFSAPTPTPRAGSDPDAVVRSLSVAPLRVAAPTAAPVHPKPKKSRPKNKGLQELLARKKQAESAISANSSLSSFLSEL